MAELYRKKSIDKLSNPEQLDRAIIISSPISWLALIGIALIIIATVIWSVKGKLVTTADINGVIVSSDNTCAIHSDMSGTVSKISKKVGDKVKVGEEIARIKDATGKESIIKATYSGTIMDYLIEPDSKVYTGAEIVRYTPDNMGNQVVVCYVPIQMAKQLEKDMEISVYPGSVDTQETGYMKASIEIIPEYAANTNNLWYVLGAENLIAEQFLTNGPVVAVVCSIETDENTESGFYWSRDKGKDIVVSNGTFVTAKVVMDECAPIEKLLRNIKEKLED